MARKTATSTVALNVNNEAVEAASIEGATAALRTATDNLGKPAKATPKAKARKVKAMPKPEYVQYDNQKDIERALLDIGTEIENISVRVVGVLRDKTCILAINYAWLQANKEGGWTFDTNAVIKFVKDAMFPKETQDDSSILSRSSLYKNCELAVKLARIIHAKKGKFQIKEHDGNLRVMAPWGYFEPTIVSRGHDVKNTEMRLLCVPSWVIEARYAHYFDEKTLTKYGKVDTSGKRTPQVPGTPAVAVKAIDTATMPEVLERLDSLTALIPDDANLSADMKKKVESLLEVSNRLLKRDPNVVEVKQVIEYDIPGATFEQLLQSTYDRMPTNSKEWTNLNDNERDLLALIAERVQIVAVPVKLSV